ncbi:hypothetical protein KAR91_69485 [Candidatus Pacearchaeota archaeon]|nr:hypothetical protein [Candidatus Pacearchaeota archaeon]
MGVGKIDGSKIDNKATDGLTGVEGSLAYRIEEIEKHFHNIERWRGKHATQAAAQWADDVLTPFQAISGADTYGADANDEAKVLGLDDTPIDSEVRFDPSQILILDLSSDTVYKLRMVWGTGTMADAITAKQYTEKPVVNQTTGSKAGGTPVMFRVPRLHSGIDKVWIQAWNATDNATVSFLIGQHPYEG